MEHIRKKSSIFIRNKQADWEIYTREINFYFDPQFKCLIPIGLAMSQFSVADNIQKQRRTHSGRFIRATRSTWMYPHITLRRT